MITYSYAVSSDRSRFRSLFSRSSREMNSNRSRPNLVRGTMSSGDLRPDNDFPQGAILDQAVVQVLFPDRRGVDPHAARRVSLGVAVDQKGSLSPLPPRGPRD